MDRRFTRLIARIMLYLRAKLRKLEVTQDTLNIQDLQTADESSKQAAAPWEGFGSRAEVANSEEKKRLKEAKKIEASMRSYRRSRNCSESEYLQKACMQRKRYSYTAGFWPWNHLEEIRCKLSSSASSSSCEARNC